MQIPLIEELQESFPTKYDLKEIRNCELFILKSMNYSLKSISIYDFSFSVLQLCGKLEKIENLIQILETAYSGIFSLLDKIRLYIALEQNFFSLCGLYFML